MDENDRRATSETAETGATGPVDNGVDGARFRRHLDHTAHYPYPGPPQEYEIFPPKWRGRLRMTEVRFASLHPSGHPENDTVRARFFRRAGPSPGQPLVFLHGFGPRWLWCWESFATSLAARGFPTMLVCLPFLCERAITGVHRGAAYSSADAAISLPAYEQAASDTRAALDWLLLEEAKRPADAGRPGPALLGISLGALVAVITASLEPRVESVVSVLGGADLDAIVFKGILRTVVQEQLDRARVEPRHRREARRIYGEYLREVRRAPHPLDVPAPYHYFLLDPLTFASHLKTRPVLMINARFDPIMPRLATEQLWLELGKPPLRWLWGTHWPGGPWKPYVMRTITQFLRGLPPGATRTPADSEASPELP